MSYKAQAIDTRRPHRHARHVLGIDVGGTSIRAGLFDPSAGSLHHVRSIPTQASHGARHSLARALTIAREVVGAGRAAGLSVHKVGIGVPELVSSAGHIDSAGTLRWRSNSVRTRLRIFGAVTIASDVRAAALAEARLGAGRKQSVFLYVSVGTGISCTLVIDGKPFLGAHGHAVAFASGASCTAADTRGKAVMDALEARASGPALVRRAGLRGCIAADAIAVCRAAGERSGIMRDVVDAAATELAVHVAILSNALDPQLILLGGGLGGAPGRYWTTFRAALPRFTYGRPARRVRVRRAQLGAKAGMIGAALSAIEAEHA